MQNFTGLTWVVTYINLIKKLMNTDPKDKKKWNDQDDQQKHTGYQQEKNEDNGVQEGLTGETDDEEDVSGDLAGNAAGNPED